MAVQMCCGQCGIEFAVPDHFHKERKESGQTWYCPNGHPRVYKESESDKMRRERDIAIQQKARAESEAAATQRKLVLARKEATRLKKRMSAGVCPCCTRTVSQLARHMKTKHPEFVADEKATVVPFKKAKK